MGLGLLTQRNRMPNLKCRSNELPIEENLLERKTIGTLHQSSHHSAHTSTNTKELGLDKLGGWHDNIGCTFCIDHVITFRQNKKYLFAAPIIIPSELQDEVRGWKRHDSYNCNKRPLLSLQRNPTLTPKESNSPYKGI